jgi:FlaG/FlaF family flagellin (archaellin)
MQKKIETIKKKAGKLISPTFLALLLLSFLMWCLIVMGDTYKADVTLPVDIDGTRIKVKCETRGTGYRIIAYRYLLRSDIKLSLSDVTAEPSNTDDQMLVIEPVSLRKAISVQTKDLEILAVSDYPEIPANL